MAYNITVSDGNELTIAIKKALEDYSEEVGQGVRKAAEKTAREAVQKLKATSPRSDDGNADGSYASGWTSKKVRTAAKGDIVDITIHNRTKPGLTHLLEKGHALVNGERSRKFVHIKPVEEEAIKKFEERVEEVIRNGG